MHELVKTLIVNEFINVFSDMVPGLPLARAVQFAINSVSDTVPICRVLYLMAPLVLKELKAPLQELSDHEFIWPSVSPWGIPVVLVRKKDNNMRLYIDIECSNM